MRELEAALEALEFRSRFEHLLLGISTDLIQLPREEMDRGIQRALGEIGELAGVDRGYLFQFSGDGSRAGNSHEWCAPGIEPQIGQLQDLSVAGFPWVMEGLRRGEVVDVPRLDDLPPEAGAERRMFEAQGIRSLILIPLAARDELVGFVGFDSVRGEKAWTADDRFLLQAAGQILVNALLRWRAEEALQRARAELERRVEERTAELAAAVAEVTAAKEAAEAAYRARSSFLASMNHELRTPLNAILGFSDLLLADGSALSEKQRHQVQNIQTGGRRLLELITDLLDLASIEAGRLRLSYSTVDVPSVLEAVVERARVRAREKGLTLTFEAGSPLPPIEADARRFSQALWSLLENALKFTPEGGRIRVRAETAEDGGREVLRVSVTDTGIGLDAGLRQRLFATFERGEGTLAARYRGTGAGLALSRELVELHGGRIWAESEGPGRGSTFTFALPLRRGEGGAA